MDRHTLEDNFGSILDSSHQSIIEGIDHNKDINANLECKINIDKAEDEIHEKPDKLIKNDDNISCDFNNNKSSIMPFEDSQNDDLLDFFLVNQDIKNSNITTSENDSNIINTINNEKNEDNLNCDHQEIDNNLLIKENIPDLISINVSSEINENNIHEDNLNIKNEFKNLKCDTEEEFQDCNNSEIQDINDKINMNLESDKYKEIMNNIQSNNHIDTLNESNSTIICDYDNKNNISSNNKRKGNNQLKENFQLRRTEREFKKVTFYEVPIIRRISKVKSKVSASLVQNGQGIHLGNIPTFELKLKKLENDSQILINLHKLLFKSVGYRSNRKRDIRRYNGMNCGVENKKEEERIKRFLLKLNLTQIRNIAELFGFTNKEKEESVIELAQFLLCPSADKCINSGNKEIKRRSLPRDTPKRAKIKDCAGDSISKNEDQIVQGGIVNKKLKINCKGKQNSKSDSTKSTLKNKVKKRSASQKNLTTVRKLGSGSIAKSKTLKIIKSIGKGKKSKSSAT